MASSPTNNKRAVDHDAPASPTKHAATDAVKKAKVAPEATRFELHYFNVRAKAELVRLILAFTGVSWENKMTSSWENWLAEKKETTPFGQLPMLVEFENGVEVFKLAQSHAMARYLGHKYGLIPSHPHHAALMDSVFESVTDLENFFSRMNYEKDEKIKATLKETLYTDKLVAFAKYNEKILVKNGNNGYFVGKEATIADIYAFSVLERLEYDNDPRLAEILKTAPALSKSIETIRKHPKLSAFMAGDRCPVIFQA
ncbi:hypothetical protein HDU78_005883 [Chytriomyces hyalinus]|nr:hypothetical protein HDU78_005883 [Chytriomyces hyalinus]